eukprot:TRINITY_DN3004_c0_g1_i15.p1 TRINITY_DN3004_c0_g1~~TRINITY_DN3004_c0_g1_i15.p1  ORF type:complete len:488 (-),score=91.99 TRINITY_DN3004_c0_g1_i15:781-2244(-)
MSASSKILMEVKKHNTNKQYDLLLRRFVRECLALVPSVASQLLLPESQSKSELRSSDFLEDFQETDAFKTLLQDHLMSEALSRIWLSKPTGSVSYVKQYCAALSGVLVKFQLPGLWIKDNNTMIRYPKTMEIVKNIWKTEKKRNHAEKQAPLIPVSSSNEVWNKYSPHRNDHLIWMVEYSAMTTLGKRPDDLAKLLVRDVEFIDGFEEDILTGKVEFVREMRSVYRGTKRSDQIVVPALPCTCHLVDCEKAFDEQGYCQPAHFCCACEISCTFPENRFCEFGLWKTYFSKIPRNTEGNFFRQLNGSRGIDGFKTQKLGTSTIKKCLTFLSTSLGVSGLSACTSKSPRTTFINHMKHVEGASADGISGVTGQHGKSHEAYNHQVLESRSSSSKQAVISMGVYKKPTPDQAASTRNSHVPSCDTSICPPADPRKGEDSVTSSSVQRFAPNSSVVPERRVSVAAPSCESQTAPPSPLSHRSSVSTNSDCE